MTRIALPLLVLLMLASPGWAQVTSSFTRGQWTRQAGAGDQSFAAHLWLGDGVAKDRTLATVTQNVDFGTYIGFARQQFVQPWVGNATAGGYDSTRRRWVVFPVGGDQSWSGWEINEIDFPTGIWNPNGRPLAPYTQLVRPGPMPFLSGEIYPGPHPNVTALLDPGHLYDSAAKIDAGQGVRLFPQPGQDHQSAIFMPTVGRFLFLPGFNSYYNNQVSTLMWEWDPTLKQWEGLSGDWPGQNPWGNGYQNVAGVWDSVHNWVIWWDGQFIYRYDPTRPHGSRNVAIMNTNLANSNSQGSFAFDSKRGQVLFVTFLPGPPSNLQQTWVVSNLSGTPSLNMQHINGADNLSGTKIPALIYDVKSDRYLLWGGGRTIYWVDPVSFVATAYTPTSGIDPLTRTWGLALGGYILAYDSTYDVYVTLNGGPFTQGMEVFAPLREPQSSFTDLIVAKATGNPDTGFGQTQGLDGSFVTLWGHGFGSTQGTSTITVGGVSPRVISWGNATPPTCGPANLANTYQQLQCIVFQVDHATPGGPQNIIVTVGGVAQEPVPITITSLGTIYIVPGGSFSSIQSALNGAQPNDMFYFKNGTDVQGGVNMPPNNITPLYLATYPGASVQVGNPNFSGFNVSSGGGLATTYSKFKVYASGNSPGITPTTDARVVGNLVQAPNGTGSSGAVGPATFILSGNQSTFGNEFTNCGLFSTDQLYHTLYIGGVRNQTGVVVQHGYNVGWNYFHDNTAYRAINFFSQSNFPSDDIVSAITGLRVHDNVIVNQNRDGMLIGAGVVGENWIYNNLLINVGSSSASDGSGVAINLRTGDPTDNTHGTFVNTGLPPLIHIFNNTVLNAGSTLVPANNGIFEFVFTGLNATTLDIHSNIFYQANGLSYISAVSSSLPGAGQSTKNLWFGAGTPPSFDGTPVFANPLLSSSVSPYNLHLQPTSPAILAGVNNSGLGLGLNDFDGVARPLSAAWDIGAYQSTSVSAPSPPTGLTGHAAITGSGGIQ